MSITAGDIVFWLRADDKELNSNLADAGKKTEGWAASLGGSLDKILGGAVLAGVAAVTAAVVGIGKAAWDAAMDFDDAFDNIVTQTGATGQELEQLQDDFTKVFTSIPTDAGTASDAIATLNQRLGVTGEELTNLATPLIESARLMGGDVKTRTEGLTRVMGDWGVSIDDASGLLDKFFVAQQQTGSGMDQLMQQVVQFGAPLRLMGFTLDESISLFGKWEQEGVNAELVMGSLRIAAGKFADEGKPLRESLLSTFESIKSNTDETAALALAMEVFGARAGPDMAAAIREGRFEIDDMVAALQGADGAIMNTAAQTADFGEKWTVTKNKISTALEPLGSQMLDFVNILADNALPKIEEFITWLSGMIPPDLVEQVMGLKDTIVEMISGPEVAGGMETMKQLWADIMAALGNFEVFWTENGPEITAIVKENLDKMLESLNKLGDWFTSEVMPFLIEQLDKFSAWFVENGPLITEFLGTMGDLFTEAFDLATIAVTGMWEVVEPLLDGALTIILDLGKTIMQVATGDWAGAWETIKEAGKTGLDAVKESFNEFATFVLSWFGKDWQEVKDTWQENWDMLKTIVETVWGKIKEKFQSAWSEIKGSVTELVDNVKKAWTDIDWSSIGSDIINGIKSGVESAAGALAAAAWQAAKDAIQYVKDKIEGHSPSRLTARVIGGPMAQGIGVGFVDAMDNVKAQIGASVTGVIEGADMGNTVITNNTYNLTAQYGYQTEGTLIDRVRLLELMSARG